jgi:Ni,Fe-hydrogenase I large subunit
MTHTWQHSPGSKQHWLYRGSGISNASRILGMIYEVNPTAFTVYKEIPPQVWNVSTREFVTQVETLEEAQGLLLTLVNSRIGETT